MVRKPHVAFICTHNGNRSQIAEGLARLFAPDEIDAVSAGEDAADEISPLTVQIFREMYGVDLAETQRPKALSAIWQPGDEPYDYVVTMGCEGACPSLVSRQREDWNLDSLSGTDPEHTRRVIRQTEFKLKDFVRRVRIDTDPHLNDTIRHQLNHRTIRRFEPGSLPEEQVRLLFEVARRTASSTCAQSYSIIRIEDRAKRREVARLGGQDYIADEPLLLLFVVDNQRNYSLAREQGLEAAAATSMDSFTQGFTDAVLAVQNMVNAAESFGLGTNIIGNVLNDPAAIIELFELPRLTFPVLGLGIGVPAESPQLKPRFNNSLRVFTDRYERPGSYLEALADYDDEMREYYDLRDKNNRLDAFTVQIARKMEQPPGNRAQILRAVEAQGYDLGLDPA